jgi:hypothetical protein
MKMTQVMPSTAKWKDFLYQTISNFNYGKIPYVNFEMNKMVLTYLERSSNITSARLLGLPGTTEL